ncbi:MAG: DUF4097 family beta strand repeat protein [bacterium]|nr:DUF4097 family beta strand repeat protein [bacterium]
MKRIAALLLLALAACASPTPYATSIGLLEPGATISVTAQSGTINAYKPKIGDPSDRFTIAATSKLASLAAPTIRRAGNGISVSAPDGVKTLLVRVPDRVNLVVRSSTGDINVTDVTGNVTAAAGTGNVRIMVPGFAQASAEKGDLNVTFGATTWPGTLSFTTGSGDIEVYVKQIAKFRVHLHTDDGTLFTDFGLRGTSQGNAETIDGAVNGGGHAAIDIVTHKGSIRLLELTPQA